MNSYIRAYPWHATLWLVGLFSILHLLVIGIPELTNDEAQYALYGYYLDWSYFDHPPLVGWLNALVLPFSTSDFALRLWPVLLAAISGLFIHGLTRDLFPEEPAWLATLAVAVFQSGVMFQMLAMAMLPDTPLLPIALATAWLLFRTLRDGSHWPWLGIGLLFGLAGLSKYTAVTLVPTAILGLMIFRRYRLLLTPWPWLAMIVAGIVILPILYWNARHDWISFLYQLGHGMPAKEWQLRRMLESQLGQLLAYSGIFVFGLIAVITGLREPHPGVRFSLAFALPVLLLFGWNSGYEHSLLHWTALGWAALTPLIARWLAHHWSRRVVRIGTYLSAGYSLTLILILHSLLAFAWLPFEANRHPLEDIYGWKAAAARAMQLREQMASKDNAPAPVLFVGNWSVFSRLAWYARPVPVQVTDTRFGQSDIWYGIPEKGARGIVVVPPKYRDRPQTSGIAKFEHCEQKDKLEIILHDKPATTYLFYACTGYRG